MAAMQGDMQVLTCGLPGCAFVFSVAARSKSGAGNSVIISRGSCDLYLRIDSSGRMSPSRHARDLQLLQAARPHDRTTTAGLQDHAVEERHQRLLGSAR